MTTPRPDGWERKYEIHFPQNYVQHHPWGWGDVPYQLRVSRLWHVTHDEQAEQIRRNAHQFRQYHFKVHRKYGKSYGDHDHFGESYRYTPGPATPNEGVPGVDTPCYRPIPDTEPIFPGYYSWWGLAVDPQDRRPSIENKYLPPSLKSPAESIYGNNSFNASFPDLLQSYATSRSCRDIYLKVGGTLRYKREIAYVVIVCTSRDLGALDSYYPISHSPPDVFDPSGLVNKDGKIIDMTRAPYFTTHYMNTYVSYETLNFALYLCEEEELRCHSNTITESKLTHEFCNRSKPMATWFDKNTKKFVIRQVCVNHIQEHQQKHNEVVRFAKRYKKEWIEI